ncbi:MAG: hypothetical protein QHC40_01050 [Sphingobium sp.]|nr:hypothetical protein [Sphingobium sp.]
METDVSVRPARWLSMGGALTYTDGRVSPPSFDYGPYADSPMWSGSAFAEVSQDLGADTGKLSLRGDLFAQSKMFFSNLTDTRAPGTDIKGYTLDNSRLT